MSIKDSTNRRKGKFPGFPFGKSNPQLSIGRSATDQVWLDLEHDASATLTLGGVNLPYINTGIHFTPGVVNTIQMHLKTGTSTGAIDIWLNNSNQSSPNYHGTGLDVGTSTINFVHGGLNYVPETGLSDTYYDDFTINNGFIL